MNENENQHVGVTVWVTSLYSTSTLFISSMSQWGRGEQCVCHQGGYCDPPTGRHSTAFHTCSQPVTRLCRYRVQQLSSNSSGVHVMAVVGAETGGRGVELVLPFCSKRLGCHSLNV